MSSEEDSPSLAWSLSALMSVSTYSEREKPQQVGFQASCFCLVMSILLKKTKKMEKQAPHIHSIENEHKMPFRQSAQVTRGPQAPEGQPSTRPEASASLRTPASSCGLASAPRHHSDSTQGQLLP